MIYCDASPDHGSMPMEFTSSLSPRPPGLEPMTPSFSPLLHGVLLIVPWETPDREQNISLAVGYLIVLLADNALSSRL